MMKRMETGELLYIPRLEKVCRYLQERMKELVDQNERIPHELQFSAKINHYTKMILSTILDRDNEENGEYLIVGLIYSIELCERSYTFISEEVGMNFISSLMIVSTLISKLDKYNLKCLYFCRHCDQELVEKNKECCDACNLHKITYHDMCAICQDDDFKILPSVWAKLECGHVFHRHCILQIIPHQPKRIKCPLCRNDQVADSFII